MCFTSQEFNKVLFKFFIAWFLSLAVLQNVKINQIRAANIAGTLTSLHTTQTCTQLHLYFSSNIDPLVLQCNLPSWTVNTSYMLAGYSKKAANHRRKFERVVLKISALSLSTWCEFNSYNFHTLFLKRVNSKDIIRDVVGPVWLCVNLMQILIFCDAGIIFINVTSLNSLCKMSFPND